MKFLRQANYIRYVITKLSKSVQISMFFLVSQVLPFKHAKESSKNVADTTFKELNSKVERNIFQV